MSIPSLPPAAPPPAGPAPSSSSSKTTSSAGDFHKLVQQHLDRDDRGRTRSVDRREHEAHSGTTDGGRTRADKAPVAKRTATDGTVSRGVDQGLTAAGQPGLTASTATSTPVVVPSNVAPSGEASGSKGSSAQALGAVATGAAVAGQVAPVAQGTPGAVAGQGSPSVRGVPAGASAATVAAGSGAATATAGPATPGAAGTAPTTTTDAPAATSAATTPATEAAVPGAGANAAVAPEPVPSTAKATSEPATADKKTEATTPASRDAGPAQTPGSTTLPHTNQAPQVAAGTPASAASGPGQATPTTSAHVLDQVLPVVPRLVSRGDGTQRLTLKLHPADLGEVHLTVTVKGGSVDVTLAAGHEAREALRDGSAQLRSLLQLTGHTTGELVIRDLPTPAGAAAPVAAQTGHVGAGGGDSSPAFTQQGGGRGQQEQGAGRPGGHVPNGRTAVTAEPERPISQVVDGGAVALDVRI